jgi:hypothetical protein
MQFIFHSRALSAALDRDETFLFLSEERMGILTGQLFHSLVNCGL